MLQYLIILLAKDSVAYCHRSVNKCVQTNELMPLETLKAAIRFGMQENLMIQFVYPAHDLPQAYMEVIDSIDHVNIRPLGVDKLADHPAQEIFVADSLQACKGIDDKTLVLRLPIREAIESAQEIADLIGKVERLNLCYTDLITKDLSDDYKRALDGWKEAIIALYKEGKKPQFNLLTDRLQLKAMHNCEAGVSNITIASNGKFYICPAFYYDELEEVDNKLHHATLQYTRSVGDLAIGLTIPNQHLLQLKYAPVCRICDAFHCHRCVWQNERTTFDRNTPSHEQCLQAHLERNASRELLDTLKQNGIIFDNEIKEIDYLDPFVIANQWK